ncbi:heparinase II/III-family protein, partial [bacterium]|nr:heparinase II/III-family protein [bacterium]
AVLVMATHDGYAQSFGLLHRRRIYLADSGEDLRGEDTLEPVLGREPPPQAFVVRFHLHPSVKATLGPNGDAALLRLPVGGVWRLQVRGGGLELQDSIYLGQGEEPRPSLQVAISGWTGAEPVTVKWALRRERKPG